MLNHPVETLLLSEKTMNKTSQYVHILNPISQTSATEHTHAQVITVS